MKKILLLWLFLPLMLYAQEGRMTVANGDRDSLIKRLAAADADTNKVNLHLELVKALINTAPAEALKHAEQALALSQELSWQEGMGRSHRAAAAVHKQQEDLKSALRAYGRSAEAFTRAGNQDSHTQTLKDMGELHFGLLNMPVAQKYFLRALDYYVQQGNRWEQADVLRLMGNVNATELNQQAAILYYRKSLKIFSELNDRHGIARVYNALGYTTLNNDPRMALGYLHKAFALLPETDNKVSLAMVHQNLGATYKNLREYQRSYHHFQEALRIGKEISNISRQSAAHTALADLYLKAPDTFRGLYVKRLATAHDHLDKALALTQSFESWKLPIISGIYDVRYKLYEQQGNSAKAFEALKLAMKLKDSMRTEEKALEVMSSELQLEHEKKQAVLKEQNIETGAKLEIAQANASRDLGIIFGLGGALMGVVCVTWVFYSQNKKRIAINSALTKEKQKSDNLLLNILPAEVAEELKEKGQAEVKQFDDVTVLFTDFVNFTKVAERLSPKELVSELDHCFRAFDEITGRYEIEKIKTIGDAYLAVCGLPVANARHAELVVMAALEIRHFMAMRKQELGDNTFDIRIGVHSGPVVAGIVGVKKFAYDIWGDTVNTAARMEQSGLPGHVNISAATYSLIEDQFDCTTRGEITAKNKGAMGMYFVEGRKGEMAVSQV